MILGIHWAEWLGYAASTVVAVSLLMKSLIKLRWINTIGSLLFAIYGFVIGAIPVGAFNTIIIFINLYFLYRMYRTQETFELMDLGKNDAYLERFVAYYQADIQHFFPKFAFDTTTPHIGFYILRDMVTTGFFMGHLAEEGVLVVDVDYTIPAYRDLKGGRFVFEKSRPLFVKNGIRLLRAQAANEQHANYLLQMGFLKTASDFERAV